MNKEPIGLYIFRFVIGLGLFAFMALLYWSSELLESNVQNLQGEVSELKTQVLSLQEETNRVRTDVLQTVLSDQKNRQEILKAIMQNHGEIQHLKQGGVVLPQAKAEGSQLATSNSGFNIDLQDTDPNFQNRPNIDPSLPNLLTEDPYYTKILPEQLGPNFRPKGTRREAVVGRPDNLHFFNNVRTVSQLWALAVPQVTSGKFGYYESPTPGLAVKLEARKVPGSETPEFWVHLRDKVYWQPLKQQFFPSDLKLAPMFLKKHQVTAHDFKFFLDTVNNPHIHLGGVVALRNYVGDIEELEVIDDLTFRVRWKEEDVENAEGKTDKKIKYIAQLWTGALRPLPRWVYQYFADGSKIIEDDGPDTYRENSVWAQNFSEHWSKNVIVSIGPYIFDGMTEEQVRFRRNSEYYNPYAALVEDLVFRFKESPEGVWQDFKAGNLDTYSLRPSQMVELEDFQDSTEYAKQAARGSAIHGLEYIQRSFFFIGWNQTNPLFQDKTVRQALSMAVDRDRIIRQNLNGMGVPITGPMFLKSPAYDDSIEAWPFDPKAAARLLEENGWFDTDGDGVLDKEIDGKRVAFRFTLLYYVKNEVAKVVCEYIASALKDISVDCQLSGTDWPDVVSEWQDKSFDAIYFGWGMGTPPEEPKQIWHSSGAQEKGSSNGIGFANQEADQIIELLQYEYDREERIKLYHRFHKILHEEAPYTFLYSPKATMLYRDYVENLFIPSEEQELLPGANISEPALDVIWIEKQA